MANFGGSRLCSGIVMVLFEVAWAVLRILVRLGKFSCSTSCPEKTTEYLFEFLDSEEPARLGKR